MINIKAQYSIEFILVFAFSLVIIIPLINVLHSEYAKSKQNLDESQVAQMLDDISIAAYNTYYAGYPARTTLELYFPAGIRAINSTNIYTSKGEKSELVFHLRDKGKEAIAVYPFNLSVEVSPSDGKRRIIIKAEKGNYVNITDLK
ncbi:hypothetical protein GF323_02215 [Candidatus Woesearchaeota archaeon]|nr:hypothetical protein [Candidatus Woesearchaeota archaeon]